MPLSSLSIIKSSRDSTNPSYLATFLKEEFSRFARIKELMARKLKGTHPLKYIKKKKAASFCKEMKSLKN